MIETAALVYCERFQRVAAAWLHSQELVRTNHMLSALEELAGFNYGFVYLLNMGSHAALVRVGARSAESMASEARSWMRSGAPGGARSATPIVKIGFSEHPMRRIRELIPSYGGDLRLRACFVGEPQAEREAHRRFAHLRIENERFMAHPAIEAYFAAMREEMRRRLQATHLCSSECPQLVKGLDLPMLRSWLGT